MEAREFGSRWGLGGERKRVRGKEREAALDNGNYPGQGQRSARRVVGGKGSVATVTERVGGWKRRGVFDGEGCRAGSWS